MWGARSGSRDPSKSAARRLPSSTSSAYVHERSSHRNAAASLPARARRTSAAVVIAWRSDLHLDRVGGVAVEDVLVGLQDLLVHREPVGLRLDEREARGAGRGAVP